MKPEGILTGRLTVRHSCKCFLKPPAPAELGRQPWSGCLQPETAHGRTDWISIPCNKESGAILLARVWKIAILKTTPIPICMRTELLMAICIFGLGVVPAFSQSRSSQPRTQNLTSGTARANGLNFKDLPWSVQKAMLVTSGRAGIEQVEKVDLNGRTVYVGHYKKYGKAREVLVASDGSLVRDGGRLTESAGAQRKRSAPRVP